MNFLYKLVEYVKQEKVSLLTFFITYIFSILIMILLFKILHTKVDTCLQKISDIADGIQVLAKCTHDLNNAVVVILKNQKIHSPVLAEIVQNQNAQAAVLAEIKPKIAAMDDPIEKTLVTIVSVAAIVVVGIIVLSFANSRADNCGEDDSSFILSSDTNSDIFFPDSNIIETGTGLFNGGNIHLEITQGLLELAQLGGLN